MKVTEANAILSLYGLKIHKEGRQFWVTTHDCVKCFGDNSHRVPLSTRRITVEIVTTHVIAKIEQYRYLLAYRQEYEVIKQATK